MCTKTKTSFGCGHCTKIVEPCGILNCQHLDTWKIAKPVDCAKCKAAGEASTRGKDGRGRYGIEHTRHRESRQSSAEAPTSGTANMAISPWARKSPEVPQEKLWNTPTRQKADEAWVVEHERRMSDLEEKTNKMSLKSNTRGSRRTTPHGSYERIFEVTELFDEPDDLAVLPSKSKPVNLLPYEIEEASRTYSRSRSRKISYDSEGSMPCYQESPLPLVKTPRRKIHFVPPISEYSPPEHHEPRRSRQTGSKTEPCYPQSCCFESPMPRSHPTQDNWMNQYAVIQPMYREPSYPRTYPVY